MSDGEDMPIGRKFPLAGLKKGSGARPKPALPAEDTDSLGEASPAPPHHGRAGTAAGGAAARRVGPAGEEVSVLQAGQGTHDVFLCALIRRIRFPFKRLTYPGPPGLGALSSLPFCEPLLMLSGGSRRCCFRIMSLGTAHFHAHPALRLFKECS